MEISLFSVIGYLFISLGGYLGYIYYHTGFDQIRFDKWRMKYLHRFPDAESEEAEEYFRTQQGAPLGQWLQGKYLRELKWGKRIAMILGIVGGFFAIFPVI